VKIRVLWYVAMFGVLVALVPLIPAQAQDGGGLSDEQLALLDRLFMAQASLEAYESYSRVGQGTGTQTITIRQGEASQTIGKSVSWTGEGTAIRGDSDNIHATYGADVEITELAQAGESPAYTSSTEVRVVDDVVYVNVEVIEANGEIDELDELPAGWFVLGEEDDYNAFNMIPVGNINQEDALLDYPDVVRAAAADVTLEPVILTDGTLLDAITVRFERDGLIILFTESPTSDLDEDTAALITMGITERSYMTMTVLVDAENNMLGIGGEVLYEALDLDLRELSPGAREGIVFDLIMESSREEKFSQVNEPVEPVAAPEVITE
jgi:hypothetical protein